MSGRSEAVPARNEVVVAHVEAELLRFVADEVAVDGAGLTADERLVESGRIDSLGLVALLAHVGRRWAVDLAARGEAGDLESIASLARAIARERGARAG